MTTTKPPELPDDEAVLRQFIAGEKNQCGDYWHRSTATEALGRILAGPLEWSLVGQEISPNYAPKPIQHPGRKPPEPMLIRYYWKRAVVAWTEGRCNSEPPRPDDTRPAVPDGWRLVPVDAGDNTVVLFCDEHGNQWTDCADWALANSCGFPPTHWQPLPPAPRSES